MKKTMQKIFGRFIKWYRCLFVEFPDGYGDPMSNEVEQFQSEMNEKKEPMVPTRDEDKHHDETHE